MVTLETHNNTELYQHLGFNTLHFDRPYTNNTLQSGWFLDAAKCQKAPRSIYFRRGTFSCLCQQQIRPWPQVWGFLILCPVALGVPPHGRWKEHPWHNGQTGSLGKAIDIRGYPPTATWQTGISASYILWWPAESISLSKNPLSVTDCTISSEKSNGSWDSKAELYFQMCRQHRFAVSRSWAPERSC